MTRPALPETFGVGRDAIPAGFAERLNALERAVDEMKRARPLTNASMKGGKIEILDLSDRVVALFGRQPDGTFDVSTVDPTDPSRFVTLSQLGFGAEGAIVDTLESTNATTYTDLATAGPSVSVPIGPTGRAIVTLSSWISAPGGDTGHAGLSIDGAAPVGFNRVAVGGNGFGDIDVDAATVRLVAGLSPGSHTFKLVYRSVGGASMSFARRAIVVQPY